MKNCKPLWRETNLEVKCCQTDGLGALLEVQMSKRSTPLWRETNFEVKMCKTHPSRNTCETNVKKMQAVVARSTF